MKICDKCKSDKNVASVETMRYDKIVHEEDLCEDCWRLYLSILSEWKKEPNPMITKKPANVCMKPECWNLRATPYSAFCSVHQMGDIKAAEARYFHD